MVDSKILTIMFTDMQGFTARTSIQSRKQLNYLLELQDELVLPIIKKHKGTVVKTIGDAYMVTFESPTNAVQCGIKIQEGVEGYNANAPTAEHIAMRIAVNTGEVNVRNGDVFGEPVNVAARIEAIAEAGEVYFTESVYLSMNKNEIPSAEVGARLLKGIADEIKVYKVLKEYSDIVKSKKVRAANAAATGLISKKTGGVVEEVGKEKKASLTLPKNWYFYALIAALLILVVYLLNPNDDQVVSDFLENPSSTANVQNSDQINQQPTSVNSQPQKPVKNDTFVIEIPEKYLEALPTADEEKVRELLSKPTSELTQQEKNYLIQIRDRLIDRFKQ